MNDGNSVSLGSAYSRHGDDTYEIGNAHCSLAFRGEPGEPLRLVYLDPGGDRRWMSAGSEPVFSLALSKDGRDRAGEFRVAERTVWIDGEAVRLKILLRDTLGTVVSVHLECHEHQSMVRQWLEITAATDIAIHRVEPFRLQVDEPDLATLHTVSGVQRQGGWRPDSGPYRSFRLERESLQSLVRRESGRRSTWDETPWGALTGNDTSAGGILIALEFGGQWELIAGREAGKGTTAAFALVGIVPEIESGGQWTSPSVWIGMFPGDLDSAAAVMHRYLREVVLPKTDDAFPWVQYNTWFSFFCDFDAETLLAEADEAASLGVEVFYVDAGWWIGNSRRRDRFSSGLGNWVENREKFPDGLRAFAGQIRDRGMHFGLWVEPERVDLRTNTTGSWRPEWIAMERHGRYVRGDWPSDTETAWLCFGHPETRDWAMTWIGNLVEELGIRWLKWDSNFWGVCTSPDHGHGVGDAEASQVEGVHQVMARLRERFPDLVIENCAGGATRMDFAMARQTPAAWLNDASEPAHRSRFHNAGASYLFPPEMLNAWVTESEHENVNGQDLPDDVWRMVIRSRMLGAIGFSCRLVTWSERIKDIVREEIDRYKQELRPLLRFGSFHHLLPQPEIPSDRLPTPDVWEAYQWSAANGSRHVILGFRNVCPSGAISVLPANIEPGAWYEVTADAGPPSRHAGADLFDRGVPLICTLLASTWITIRREGGEDGSAA